VSSDADAVRTPLCVDGLKDHGPLFWDEVEKLVEEVHTDYRSMVVLVNTYQEKTMEVLGLFSQHVLDVGDDKLEPDFLLATIHQVKGQQHDNVMLANDICDVAAFRTAWTFADGKRQLLATTRHTSMASITLGSGVKAAEFKAHQVRALVSQLYTPFAAEPLISSEPYVRTDIRFNLRSLNLTHFQKHSDERELNVLVEQLGDVLARVPRGRVRRLRVDVLVEQHVEVARRVLLRLEEREQKLIVRRILDEYNALLLIIHLALVGVHLELHAVPTEARRDAHVADKIIDATASLIGVIVIVVALVLVEFARDKDPRALAVPILCHARILQHLRLKVDALVAKFVVDARGRARAHT